MTINCPPKPPSAYLVLAQMQDKSESRTISVRRNDGVSEFERIMSEVQGGSASLRVPRSITYAGGLGRSVSLAQLAATWAHHSPERVIYTTLPTDDAIEHEKFVSRVHGLALAYFASQVKTSESETNLRQALLKAAVPRIIAMNQRKYAEVARGPLIELIFVHRARHEFHSAIYKRAPTYSELMDRQAHGELIVPPAEMNYFMIAATKCLNLVEKDRVRLETFLDPLSTPIGHLLHEIFGNTAEHAYLTVDGEIPTSGLRCILVAMHQAEADELRPHAILSAEHPTSNEYFNVLRNRACSEKRKRVFVLEISILDSGQGFAASIGQSSDDVRVVARCFQKHESAKGGKGAGLGLSRVLDIISSLEGFVRFRTSTTESFFSSLTRPNEPHLFGPHVSGSLPNAVGTVVTMGIPLELSPK